LVHDPGSNEDNLGVLLNIQTIFQELDTAGVSWKLYYSTTQDQCLAGGDPDCGTGTVNAFPATTFTYFKYSTNYLYLNPTQGPCAPPTENSGSAVGDPNNSFCIDTNKIVPLTQYFIDLQNNTLPSFAWIDPGYSNNDEHPGSGQSILKGQTQAANIIGSLMTSPSWADTVFFFAYDEGGGPFEHVPPVPGHTNDNTDSSLGVTTDISSIAVNPDGYFPCLPPVAGTPTLHCDLHPSDPGAVSTDAPAVHGFAAQLGFRVPNFIVSPFTRAHYVSHTPIDHTAIIKLVESRFIGPNASLTARDAAQPNLSEFFDFNNVPWLTPPTPPTPVTNTSLGYNPCTPAAMGP
jgi:phospholipase C